MANTGPGRNPGKAGISDQRDMLAEGQIAQGRSNLIGLFHPTPQRTSTHQHNDVPFLDGDQFGSRFSHARCRLTLRCAEGSAFDCGNRGPFRREHPSRTGFSIDSVGIHDAGINRGALDDGTFGSNVSNREGHGTGEPPFLGHFG